VYLLLTFDEVEKFIALYKFLQKSKQQENGAGIYKFFRLAT